MSETTTPGVERRCDVAVIGGSAAGLAAALQVGRQARSVIVVDSGEPRNAPAALMHGFLTRDGLAPSELSTIGRAEIRSYGGEVLDGRAVDVVEHDDQFVVELVGGHRLVARRVIVATGVVDVLPEIDGVAEHWGRDVIHCPFCHGYEVRDQRIVQLITHPMGVHQAALFRHLTGRFTVVVHDGIDADHADVQPLRRAGVHLVDQRARRVVTGDSGRVVGVELADGTVLDADAVVVGPLARPRLEPISDLDVRTVEHPSGLADIVDVAPTGETSVPGLYAAGNVTDPSHQVLHASAHGSLVGAMVCHDLARADLDAPNWSSSNQIEWDRRYEGEPVWSGDPNPALVAEVADLSPGMALDVGAGEGGDAAWLAEHGWSVTAADISERSLEYITRIAADRGLPIRCVHADANAPAPFGTEQFDLVTAHYASIKRSPDRRAVENLVGAVAPGGTLLVVNHHHAAADDPLDAAHPGRAFDPNAYIGIDDVVAAIDDSTHWNVEVTEVRPRPADPGSTGHHAADVVLRARRRSSPVV